MLCACYLRAPTSLWNTDYQCCERMDLIEQPERVVSYAEVKWGCNLSKNVTWHKRIGLTVGQSRCHWSDLIRSLINIAVRWISSTFFLDARGRQELSSANTGQCTGGTAAWQRPGSGSGGVTAAVFRFVPPGFTQQGAGNDGLRSQHPRLAERGDLLPRLGRVQLSAPDHHHLAGHGDHPARPLHQDRRGGYHPLRDRVPDQAHADQLSAGAEREQRRTHAHRGRDSNQLHQRQGMKNEWMAIWQWESVFRSFFISHYFHHLVIHSMFSVMYFVCCCESSTGCL